MVIEIGGERFRRRRIDLACLRGVELDVIDRTLLVLVARQRIDQRFWRLQPGRDRARDLAAQANAALLGEIALFAITELPDHRLKALRVELAVQPLEIGIVVDRAHGFRVGLAEPHAAGLLVQRSFRQRLLQHLAINPEGTGLLRTQRTAELAAKLLQLFGVNLAELLGRNLGAANLGQRRLAKSLENVGDAPDPETDDQNAHHHGHDRLAEPV